MKKEYIKPTIDTNEFYLITNIADLNPSAVMGGIGTESGGNSVDWDDA